MKSIKDQIGNYDKWTYAGKMLRDDQTICQYNITDGATIFTSPGLDGGGGEINKANVRDTLREVFRKEGENFDVIKERIQVC